MPSSCCFYACQYAVVSRTATMMWLRMFSTNISSCACGVPDVCTADATFSLLFLFHFSPLHSLRFVRLLRRAATCGEADAFYKCRVRSGSRGMRCKDAMRACGGSRQVRSTVYVRRCHRHFSTCVLEMRDAPQCAGVMIAKHACRGAPRRCAQQAAHVPGAAR